MTGEAQEARLFEKAGLLDHQNFPLLDKPGSGTRRKSLAAVMNTFPILRVNRSLAEAYEALGSKPKFWFREGGRRLLFKAEDRGYGEDWAEVIACHLSELLGLPHVVYELAAEYDGDKYLRPGVVCENMVKRSTSLVLGNQLLLALDSDYPTKQQFKVSQHSIGAVTGVLSRLSPPPESWSPNLPHNVESALDVFVGYVLLDAWIANQDRHHENWGALLDSALSLAPTFDHAAGLARNLTDEVRQERLSTRDHNRTVEAFAKRGRSCFYRAEADVRPLGTLEAFLGFGELSPLAKDCWLERLLAVNREQIWGILEQVPEERMSPVCKDFTLELLIENRRRLLDEGNE